MATTHVYLIVLRERVVLQDISDTILEFEPGARIIAAADDAEALAALEGTPHLAVAFVEAAPRGFAQSRLGAAIRLRDGKSVFLGDAAENEADMPEATVLSRPFASETLLNLLVRLRTFP